MKFAKILGLPLSVIGLILYCPPLQDFLDHLFGESGRIAGAVVFATGWALLLGYLAYNLGFQSQKKGSR